MSINTNHYYHISKADLPESKNTRFIESYAKKFKTIRPAKISNWPDLITRDIATTSDKNLQLATFIDNFLSKKQYNKVQQEIAKLADSEMKEFYTIELIHHIMNLNKPYADVLKERYLAELGQSSLNVDKSVQAKEMSQAMRVPSEKKPLLYNFQTLRIQDTNTITRLNLLCVNLKDISYKQAEREINKIHEPSSQDSFRARFGEILFRNQKSNEALALVQAITDTSKKDETYASFVEIANQANRLKKALFFIDLITTPVSRFDKPTKKDEILAQIVDEYLNLNNAPESIPFFDKIQDKNLKNAVKDRILTAYHAYSGTSTS